MTPDRRSLSDEVKNMSLQTSSKRESMLLELIGKASTFYEDTVGILSGIFRLSEFVGRNAIEDEFFCFMAKVLVEESRCENASVFMVVGDRIHLRGAHGIHKITYNKNVSMPLGQGVAGMCALEGTTKLVTDISACEFFEQRPDSKVDIGSLLCVPIREGKRTIGVFNLSHSDKNFFTADHVRMFELLGLIVGQLTTLVGLYEVFNQEYSGLRELVKEKEASLKDITIRYKAIIDATDEMILMIEGERVIFANNALWRMLQHAPINIHDIFDRENALYLEQKLNRLDCGEATEFDLTVEIGGTHRIIGQFFIKHLLPGQHLIMMKDISLKRHMEQRSMQNEKLTSLGLLTSGIAHELNNKLTPILGFAELIDTATLSQSDQKRFFLMMNSANAAKNIVESLLSFSRNLPPEKTAFDLLAAIERVMSLYTSSLSKREIRITHQGTSDPLYVKADMNCIEQVLVNLINNAVDAIAENSGSIMIRSFVNDGYAHVQVEDSGPGIPDDIMPKIFDPFFTTKSVDKGTGLGLSICYGIINDHKGEITIENTGHGTVAQIKIPAAVPSENTVAPSVDPPEQSAQNLQSRTDAYWIMVVEDEEELQHLMTDALSPYFHVRCFRNGRDACDNIDACAWDLIISDLRMPEMDGMEFFQEIKQRCPNLVRRFIFVTGDTYDREVKHFLEDSGVPFIRKPFRIREFREIVHRKVSE
jgi:signal transduction histidine kinase/CheY-like chemotaxis protein